MFAVWTRRDNLPCDNPVTTSGSTDNLSPPYYKTLAAGESSLLYFYFLSNRLCSDWWKHMWREERGEESGMKCDVISVYRSTAAEVAYSTK